MAEMYFGAALMGMLAGAVVGNATNRVVSRGLDAISGRVGRAYDALHDNDPDDPETRYVFNALDKMVSWIYLYPFHYFVYCDV